MVHICLEHSLFYTRQPPDLVTLNEVKNLVLHPDPFPSRTQLPVYINQAKSMPLSAGPRTSSFTEITIPFQTQFKTQTSKLTYRPRSQKVQHFLHGAGGLVAAVVAVGTSAGAPGFSGLPFPAASR